MAETVETLQARRQILVDKYEDVIKGHQSHSTGDRSYANWDPATIRREIESVDRQIAALTASPASGRTIERLRRAR